MHKLFLLFTLLWALIIFAGCGIVGMRVFAGRRAALIGAAMASLAFIAGTLSPLPIMRLAGSAAATATAPSASAPAAAPAADAAAEGSLERQPAAHCASARAGGAAVGGNVDTVVVNGGSAAAAAAAQTIASGDALRIDGWASSAKHDLPANGVCLIVDGRIAANAVVTYGAQRPDVAAAFASAAVRDTGFTVRVDGAALGAGAHRLQILVLAQPGQSGLLPTPLTVNVH